MNVLNVVVPPSLAACIRFWRRRQSVDAKYWKLHYVVFCLFTDECRTRKHTPCLGSCVMSPWSIRCLTKSKFKKKLAAEQIGVVSSSLECLIIFAKSCIGNTRSVWKVSSHFECVCLESIQPFWMSRELVTWPWHHLTAHLLTVTLPWD